MLSAAAPLGAVLADCAKKNGAPARFMVLRRREVPRDHHIEEAATARNSPSLVISLTVTLPALV
jgi:hypothetical protein